jgi:copper(I)-binding protein
MKPTLGLITALLCGTFCVAHAHGVTVGTLEIAHPAILTPPAGAKSAAGYLGIVNTGSTADRLLGVETGIAKRAVLHTTEHSDDGVARMVHLDAINIPANGTVLLEPGGMHIMLMGLTGPLTQGDMIPATLVFERAGEVEIRLSVESAGARGAGHGGHHRH